MAKTKRKTKADLEAELSVANAEKNELGSETKRQKTAISSVAKEFVCPISLELPVDPVTAADGRVYNRASIQGHIDRANKDKKELKSPITNEKMNDTLVPAIQVTNMIRSLIESGAVDGGLAEQWKKVDEMKKRAENGYPDAMCSLGHWYAAGREGLMKDVSRGYKWYRKAADLDDTEGIAHQGVCLFMGAGGAQGKTEGLVMVGMAAGRGSRFASYVLGEAYFHGNSGITKNISRSKRLLEQSISSLGSGELHANDERIAKEYLKKIEDGEEN